MGNENTGLNIRNLIIIFFVLVSAQIMFLIISLLIVYTNTYMVSGTAVKWTQNIVPVLAILTISIGLIIRFATISSMKKIPDTMAKFKKYSSNMIIGWAFFIGSTFVSILALFLTKNTLYLMLAVISILIFLITVPTQKRVANDLKISIDESDELV